MKRSEIKVGEEYATTRSRDWTRWWDARCIRVVDLGPFVKTSSYSDLDLGVIDGTPTKDNYRRDAKGTYVAVRYIGNDFEAGDRVRFVSLAHLKVTWADYTAEKDAARKAQNEAFERKAKRQEAIAADCADLAVLAERLNLRSDTLGPAWRFDSDGYVVMTRDHFRALLNAALAGQLAAQEAAR